METQVFDAADLRIAFEYTGDRWRHTVFLREGNRWTPLLASVEGTSAEATPPSPAFQELRVENIASALPGRNVLRACVVQLFGQSGKDVYSAAVEVDHEHGTMDFDVALRSKHPERLAGAYSTYRLEPGWRLTAEPDGSQIALDRAERQPGVMIQSSPIEDSPGSRFEELHLDDGRGFRVGSIATSAWDAPARPRPVRWRYRLSSRKVRTERGNFAQDS